MKDNNSKQVLLSVLGVAILVVAVVGVSFAAFTFSQTGNVENKITTGIISMTYTEPENGINLTNAMPMTDDSGKVLADDNEKFDFTVTATIQDGGAGTVINYALAATTTEGATLKDQYVKVYLTDQEDRPIGDYATNAMTVGSLEDGTGASDAAGVPEGQKVLYRNTYNATTTSTYRLRMWVSEDYPIDTASGSETYTLRVNVYGKANAQ